MSIQRGLISPPVSGRTHKASQPRLGDTHRGLNAADVFAAHDTAAVHHHRPGQSYVFEHGHLRHPIQSPEKKLKEGALGVPGAARPLTPPMSRDVRHDDNVHAHHDEDRHHRASSEGEQWCAPASSIALAHVTSASSGSDAAHHVEQRFGTLTKGVAFESDEEHNPFLDHPQPRPASSTSSSELSKPVAPSAASSHAAHVHHDEYDSDQDAEGSVLDDDADERGLALSADTTPRASSTCVTTPPRRTHVLANGAGYRPARPLSAHVRVDNEDLTSVMPIRDTPMNPFLAGGPADIGFGGPRGDEARRRAQQMPGKERGKITYVFRGQKVTYADPEYDSDDDDSDDDDTRARTSAFNPHHNPDRPPRLQPRLLFPPSESSASSTAASASQPKATRPYAKVAARKTSASYLPYADLGLGESQDEDEDDADARGASKRGGLFAAQIAAKQKQASATSATQQAGASASQSHADKRHAARAALLARLDQTDWSDDDEGDEDDDGRRAIHRRGARDSSHETAQHQDQDDDDEEVEIESHLAPRTAKRGSDELQRGHQDSLDAMGRPLKRSRASYAY